MKRFLAFSKSIIEDGQQHIKEAIGEEAYEQVMARKPLYDELTRDFTIALGKQESKKQRESNGAKKAS